VGCCFDCRMSPAATLKLPFFPRRKLKPAIVFTFFSLKLNTMQQNAKRCGAFPSALHKIPVCTLPYRRMPSHCSSNEFGSMEEAQTYLRSRKAFANIPDNVLDVYAQGALAPVGGWVGNCERAPQSAVSFRMQRHPFVVGGSSCCILIRMCVWHLQDESGIFRLKCDPSTEAELYKCKCGANSQFGGKDFGFPTASVPHTVSSFYSRASPSIAATAIGECAQGWGPTSGRIFRGVRHRWTS